MGDYEWKKQQYEWKKQQYEWKKQQHEWKKQLSLLDKTPKPSLFKKPTRAAVPAVGQNKIVFGQKWMDGRTDGRLLARSNNRFKKHGAINEIKQSLKKHGAVSEIKQSF